MADVVRLAVFLDRLNWSPERLSREVNRLCGDGTVSAKAPYHWLRGAYPRRGVPDAVARVLSQHLDDPVDVGDIWPEAPVGRSVVAALVREPEITPLVRDSCNSTKLVQDVSETNADDVTLNQLDHELASVVAACLHVPPAQVVYRVVMLRDRVARLLRGHQKIAQRQRLLALGAKFCALLAWLSDDLGDGEAAHNQAAAAWDLADLAADDGARRWVRVAQSRRSYWQASFVESAQYAVDGLDRPAADGLDALLRLMEARSWAAAGRVDEARAALVAWADDCGRGCDENHSSHDVGLFAVGRDRQSYLAGHTLLLLDEPERALQELYGSRAEMSRLPAGELFYPMPALVGLDIVRARTHLGDLHDACEAHRLLEPVFELGSDQMTTMMLRALRDAAREMLGRSDRNAGAADLARRIEGLASGTDPEPAYAWPC